jgi:protoheme IX farnesyltransferase
MRRSARQTPIPSGTVSEGEALGIGLALSGFHCAVVLGDERFGRGLACVHDLFYAVIYSMWKRSTPQNIVIGGAASAFPNDPVGPWPRAAYLSVF